MLPLRRQARVAASLAALVLGIALAVVLTRSWPRPPLTDTISSSTAIFDRHGQLLRLTLSNDDQYRLWTPLDQVTPELIEALLLHEDRHFYRHLGINPVALIRASVSSYFGSERIGASTITMQLARLKYRLNTRTIPGKLQQIARALQLELCYSKAELLEAHLNLMPFGRNIQGVGAASLIYFDKSAASLDLAESLSLVLIPQSPARRAPLSDRIERDDLVAARARLWTRWLEHHPTARTLTEHMAQPLRFRSIADLPFHAPHFVQRVLVDAVSTNPPTTDSLRTSLDLALQQRAERVIGTYIDERAAVGIHNAAAMIVNYRDGSIRALVGSADFANSEIRGQVDGTSAKRSPGSVLKPFIYALAIDQGVIHPLSVLKDAPTAFGPFSPENFDGRFIGPITASDALSRSRNIPAIALSAQLGNPNFYQFLKSAGIANMASEHHYGLALALGGGEATMQEIATLYAMLANRGVLAPLTLSSSAPALAGPRVLSEEASFMTLEMLRAPRPGEMQTRALGNATPAWKTGTSWGFRDAWTAGIIGPYVVVVWIGNFEGHGNPAFIGVQAAAPLFFRLADALAANERLFEPSFRQPPQLERVEVCSASGDLPNADCPRTQPTWYIPGVSPMRLSQVHRRVWIDTRTGNQACAPFDPAHTRSEVFEFWPSDVMQLFERAGMPRRRPPAAAECALDGASGVGPSITSPVIAVTYTMRLGNLQDDAVPLAANADSEVRRLHWFIDNAYVGTSAPSTSFAWKPSRGGTYLVRAIDDRGRVDTRELRVELVN
jgi:penicillin-binding protein 1C